MSYVEDPNDAKFSVVLFPPQKEHNEKQNHGVEDYVMEHQSIKKSILIIDSFDDHLDDNSESSYVRENCERIWVDETLETS